MHQTLYRKYRPAIFDDVCGQDHITSVLKYETSHQKTSHAYLFCGSRGTGKTSCAKILAKAINCENPQDGNPCGKCPSCISIDRGSTIDVVEMDAASNNGVDYIRDIRDNIVYTPAELKKRVYIVDEVHMLSSGAFNALLKTLEEPPEHAVFILATTELQKLPATIVSRCQRFDFHRIPLSVIASRLKYIAEKENISLSSQAADILASQAQGGMRDAISLFELCASSSDVTAERVIELLGLSGYAKMSEIASLIADGKIDGLFDEISDLYYSSKDLSVFWNELQNFYRDMLVCNYVSDPKKYLDITADDYALLQSSASRFQPTMLIYHARILEEALQNMNNSPQNKRMIAEMAFVRLCDPKLSLSLESLSQRISELENKLSGTMVTTPATERKSENMPTIKTQPKPAEPPTSVTPSPEKKDEPETNTKIDTTETVEDISELLEVYGQMEPANVTFLTGSTIRVNRHTNQAVIQCTSSFAQMLLSKAPTCEKIAKAFAQSGITDHVPQLTFTVAAPKANPLSEFDPF